MAEINPIPVITHRTRRVLGLDLHGWEHALIWSLGFAAIAAVAVVVSTAWVVVLQREENAKTRQEFERYQLDAGIKIEEAKKEGIEAGRTAGNAMLRAAELEKEAAAARADIAATEERAKVAEQKAAEAQLELAKFRTSRREMLQGHEASIIARLKSFSGTRFDTGLSQGNGEVADLSWDLDTILTAAGWKHVAWTGSNLLITQGDLPVSGIVAAVDVEIHLPPSCRAKFLPAATALISALNELGIAATDAGFNAHSKTENAMHILIGPKR